MFVDGHVHVYPEVPLEAVFAAIDRALDRHAPVVGRSSTGPEPPRSMALVLADPTGVDGFERLAVTTDVDGSGGAAARSGGDASARWTIDGADSAQLRFRRGDDAIAVFLRARQLITSEGLEVLAVGPGGSASDGLSLARTLDAVRASGGWTTIAWGVGKWLGRRGRLVSDAVRSEAGSPDVALGDNGGRPAAWAVVPQFDAAAEHGIKVLPGSDPLRVTGDEWRIASFGFETDASFDGAASIADAIKTAIADPAAVLHCAGRRVGLGRCVANQLLLRSPFRPRFTHRAR